VSQALSGNTIVLTATAEITSGSKTVTICGVTLGFAPVDNAFGVSVTTNKDYTRSCSATGTVDFATQGTITAVSMTIPFANRVAGTQQSAVFAFTTSKSIPAAACGSSNTVTLVVTGPSQFFASGTAVATGLAGYSVSTSNLATGTFVLSGTGALNAGSFTVTLSGLTLGVRTVGSDTGVTVGASQHFTSAGTTTGPISNYQVTSVNTGACQTSSACRSVTIAINAAGDASTIAPAGTLIISGLGAFSGTPGAMSMGNTLVTSSAVSSGAVTLTVHAGGAAWTIGSTATITLTGLTMTSASPSFFNPWTLSVGGSTPMWSTTYAATSTGTTTTTGITLARAVPGTQNTQVTVTFSTTNTIMNNDEIMITYPTNFFIDPPVDFSCNGPEARYSFFGTLGSCPGVLSATSSPVIGPVTSTMTLTYSGQTIAAGAQTMIWNGVTLSTTEKAASTTFSVAVSSSSCSAGAISSGSISNSNPGGPAAKATGVHLMLSAASALLCIMMLLL